MKLYVTNQIFTDCSRLMAVPKAECPGLHCLVLALKRLTKEIQNKLVLIKRQNKQDQSSKNLSKITRLGDKHFKLKEQI